MDPTPETGRPRAAPRHHRCFRTAPGTAEVRVRTVAGRLFGFVWTRR